MDVALLRAGASVDIPPGDLQLDWSVRGGSPADAALVLTDGDGREPAGVQRLSTGRVLLQQAASAVTVSVRPGEATVFADGCQVELRVTVLDGGREVSQLVVPPRDVSGMRRDDLLSVVPVSAARWRVSAPGSPVPPPRLSEADGKTDGPGPDTGPMPPGVLHGVYAARHAVDDLQRLPPDRQVDLVVAVDRSASMHAHVRSGAVQSLLELLLGVNAVVGRGQTVDVWLAGHQPERAPALHPATVSAWTRDVLAPKGATSGTAFAPVVEAVGGATATTHAVLVTDGVPPDLEPVAELLATGTAAVRWHVLALAHSVGGPSARLQRWQDDLQALEPLTAAGLLTCSAVVPGTDPGWLDRQLADPGFRNAVVSGLPIAPATVRPPSDLRREDL